MGKLKETNKNLSYRLSDDFSPSVDFESHLFLEYFSSAVTDGDDVSVLEKISVVYKHEEF